MKKTIYLLFPLLLMACNVAEEDPRNISVYDCELSYADTNEAHPSANQFQILLDDISKITIGVQLAIRTEDGNIWTGAAGMADIPNEVQMESCTKTMIGSVTKIVTATMILQLQEEGILSIDDQLKDWLDGDLINKIENASEVTLKHLLNHTSGIYDYLVEHIFIDAINELQWKLTPEEKLEYTFGKKADHPPGQQYTYSNSNYVLLGLVIEKARNMSYDNAVKKYIAEPLGLQTFAAGTPSIPIPTGTARPYIAIRENKYTDMMDLAVYDAATGDGAIVSNMQDVLLFMEGLFDGTLVAETTSELMRTERVDARQPSFLGSNTWYGLGLEISETDYGLAYGHGGSTTAYKCFNYHFVDENITVVIAYNGDSELPEENDRQREIIIDLLQLAFN